MKVNELMIPSGHTTNSMLRSSVNPACLVQMLVVMVVMVRVMVEVLIIMCMVVEKGLLRNVDDMTEIGISKRIYPSMCTWWWCWW